jgi:peptide/nickel transport system permease protein
MTAYIARRLLQMVVVLILVTLMVFFVMRLTPGDPVYLYIARSGNLQELSLEQIEDIRHQYGLDKPMVVQYFTWVGDLFHGDLGQSILYKQSINTLLKERFPVTLYLGLYALVITTVLGILAGMVAAVWRGKWLDKIVTPLSYLGLTIPVFWLGYLLIYAFGLKLNWLPISGYTSPFTDFGLSLKQAIMPVICMSVFGIAGNARQMRSSMLEIIRQDYIRTARSKGLSERVIILRHALKNSVIPVITLIGFGVGVIFGGDVLVETVFSIPGVGYFMTTSIMNKDYVVIQSITLLISIIILVVNLLVDISYGWLDPRIRYS